MHHLYPITFALSALSVANAGAPSGVSCWKSGPTVDINNIQGKIATICNYLNGAAYTPNEEHYQCVLDDAAVKWDFALTVNQQFSYLSG